MTLARPLIIAIDGPSGAGKGTVARALAGHLHYRHVDTGAMYRAVAWKALDDRLDLNDGDAIAGLAARAAIELESGVTIDGHDVTSAIRTPVIDDAAARVARHPQVRALLVERQRAYGKGGGVVMEGRDIGSVVFPDADVKIYLDAAPDERARRRAADAAHLSGREGAAIDTVARALKARDVADRTRDASPLALAPGAIYVDTTGLPAEQVVRQVLDLVERRLGAPGAR